MWRYGSGGTATCPAHLLPSQQPTGIETGLPTFRHMEMRSRMNACIIRLPQRQAASAVTDATTASGRGGQLPKLN